MPLPTHLAQERPAPPIIHPTPLPTHLAQQHRLLLDDGLDLEAFTALVGHEDAAVLLRVRSTAVGGGPYQCRPTPYSGLLRPCEMHFFGHMSVLPKRLTKGPSPPPAHAQSQRSQESSRWRRGGPRCPQSTCRTSWSLQMHLEACTPLESGMASRCFTLLLQALGSTLPQAVGAPACCEGLLPVSCAGCRAGKQTQRFTHQQKGNPSEQGHPPPCVECSHATVNAWGLPADRWLVSCRALTGLRQSSRACIAHWSKPNIEIAAAQQHSVELTSSASPGQLGNHAMCSPWAARQQGVEEHTVPATAIGMCVGFTNKDAQKWLVNAPWHGPQEHCWAPGSRMPQLVQRALRSALSCPC